MQHEDFREGNMTILQSNLPPGPSPQATTEAAATTHLSPSHSSLPSSSPEEAVMISNSRRTYLPLFLQMQGGYSVSPCQPTYRTRLRRIWLG